MNTQQIFMRLDGVLGTRVTPSNQQDTTSISIAKGMEVVLSFSIFSGDTADSLISGSALAEYAAWEFVLNDKFDPNPVELRSTSITINQANNSVDVYISDTNTVELAEWLGESDSKVIGFALEGTRTGKTKPDLILQSTMVIYNRRNSAGEPTENPDNYYTKTALNAILSSGDEYEFSVDGETGWHSTQAEGDKYMRSRNKEIAGDWSDALELPAGPVGATPEFAIGSVTSGDTPSATITGTAKNPVLNLVLQRGEVGFLDTAETLDAGGPGYEAGSVVTWGNPVETYQVVTATTSGETPETASEKFRKIAGAGGNGYTFTPSVSASGELSWTNNGNLNNPSAVNIKGPTGATFFPSVSADGLLSWSNDGGKANPESVNIRGPVGYSFIPAVSAEGILSFTNNGNLENPAPVRVKGITFTPSVSAEGILSFTNNGGLDNPAPVSVKGPAGTGINPRGVWNSSTTYAIHDMVRGNGGTWISKSDGNTGNALPVLPEEENESWYLSQKDGAAATIQITDTETLAAGNNASFEELSGSAAQARKYKARIPSGNGISSITKTGTAGNVDTYTVAFTNGTSTTFTVTNGLNGEDGTAATIQIGSVTQGDTPSVANSGTPGAAVLDFVLPKGSTGSQGAAAISFARLVAVTDETTFSGTAQLVNADGTAGETVDIVYWFAVPGATE